MGEAWKLAIKMSERSQGLPVHITDIKEVLDVKRAMRPLHYCATPILFNPETLSPPAPPIPGDSANNRPDLKAAPDFSRYWEATHCHSSPEDSAWHVKLLNEFRELYVKWVATMRI